MSLYPPSEWSETGEYYVVLSYLTYGSDSWSMKVEHEVNLDRTEVSLNHMAL